MPRRSHFLFSRFPYSNGTSSYSFATINASLLERLLVWLSSLITILSFLYYFDTPFFASFLLYFARILGLEERLIANLEAYLSADGDFRVRIEGPIKGAGMDGYITVKNVSIVRPPSLNGASDDGKTCESAVATAYDLKIEEIKVLMSASNFHAGKGFISQMAASKIRGSIDRLLFDDRPIYRHVKRWGDFSLSGLTIEDLRLAVNYPKEKGKSYDLVVFKGDWAQVRKEWLMLDILGAKSIVGLMDGSLFSLCMPSYSVDHHHRSSGKTFTKSWENHVRILKLDSLDFEHLTGPRSQYDGVVTTNVNAMAPSLAWIDQALVDIQVLLTLPSNESVDASHPVVVPYTLDDLLSIWPSLSEEGKQRIGLFPDALGIDLTFKLKSIKANTASYEASSDDASGSKGIIAKYVKGLIMKRLLLWMNSTDPAVSLSVYSEKSAMQMQGIITLYDMEIMKILREKLWAESAILMEKESRNLENYKKWVNWLASSNQRRPSSSLYISNNNYLK